MAPLFEAYVTNAGKYSEGQLVGETLKFPTTAQEVEALLKRIHIASTRLKEFGSLLSVPKHISCRKNFLTYLPGHVFSQCHRS